MSDIAPPLCFTWAEIKNHPVKGRRVVTAKDYAAMVIASVPSVEFMLVEVHDHLLIKVTVNYDADLNRVRAVLERYRPVGTVFEVTA